MNYLKFSIIIAVSLMTFSLAFEGYVYDISLEKVPYAVVSVYSTNGGLLSRQLADANAHYDIPLPDGEYVVVAYKPGTNLYSNETIDIVSDNQRYDILLSPKLDYEKLPEMDLPGIGELPEASPELVADQPETQQTTDIGWIIAITIVALIVGIAYIIKVKQKKTLVKHSDEEYVLDIIREHNGEIKQKDIVQLTGWSEAKVSLILKELKKKGKIKKRKVGREKIVHLVS